MRIADRDLPCATGNNAVGAVRSKSTASRGCQPVCQREHMVSASVEKYLIAFTQSIEAQCSCVFEIPIAPASSTAELHPSTGTTLFRNCSGFLDEFSSRPRFKHFPESSVIQRSKSVGIVDVEVAGIDTPIGFHDKVAGAHACHAATFRRITGNQIQQIVKPPHRNRPSMS